MEEVPQVAFSDGISWSIVYNYGSMSGLWKYHPLPEADCPLVTIPAASINKAQKITQKYISPAGVSDIKKLLSELEEVGCSISYPIKVAEEQPLALSRD